MLHTRHSGVATDAKATVSGNAQGAISMNDGAICVILFVLVVVALAAMAELLSNPE